MNWNNISLYKFQKIEAVNQKKEMSDIDKTLFSTCIVFDMTEYQLDNLPINKVNRLAAEMTKIFAIELKPKPQKRIGKYFLSYDISSMRFGQYKELSFYLSNNYIQNAHKIMASISSAWRKKNTSDYHTERASFFLAKSIVKIIGCLSLVVEKFAAFNKEYNWLFGLDKDTHDEQAQNDFFNKRYGWFYASEQVAAYRRIELEAVDNMNIREVFNDLAYLKAKTKYEAELFKKK